VSVLNASCSGLRLQCIACVECFYPYIYFGPSTVVIGILEIVSHPFFSELTSHSILLLDFLGDCTGLTIDHRISFRQLNLRLLYGLSPLNFDP
jgi:hypothetical protein